MRQRNIKNLDEKIEMNSTYLIKSPETARGRWGELFGDDKPLYAEIGCGKGKFILDMARANPDKNYIAIEGQSNIALRTLEKAEKESLANLRIFIDYIKDLKDYFDEGELSGIYLNFSDPWPKAKHARRRLTYRKRLMNYMEVLADGGTVEFKTDNDGLFRFTLDEIEACDFEIAECSRDLHGSGLEAKKITTEYEDRFRTDGKNINYVKFKRRKVKETEPDD